MGGQKPMGFCKYWHYDCDRGVIFCNAITKNPWVFAYFSITTAIGVSVFAMRLSKPRVFCIFRFTSAIIVLVVATLVLILF